MLVSELVSMLNRHEERSVLYFAIEHGHVDLLKLLLKHGAALVSRRHEPPLSVACKSGSADIVKVLLDSGVDPN